MQTWNTQDIEILKDTYGKLTKQDIMNLLPQKTWVAIRNKAVRLGISREAEKGWNRKYSVANANCFDALSEQSAYWLGFLWADGFVSNPYRRKEYTIGITLQKRDEEHLRKFKQFIGTDHPLYDHGDGCVSLRVNCHQIYEKLREYGITHDKRQRTTFPRIVQGELMRPFLRGYFDGDGSLFLSQGKSGKTYFRLNFTGHKDFIEAVANEMNARFGIRCMPHKDKRSNAWQYCVNNQQAGIQMLLWMYSGGGDFLERKKGLLDGFRQ